MNLERLNEEFIRAHGEAREEIFAFFAPGRVNLIGEHTDYNDGFVLPAALSFGTSLLARKTPRASLRMATANFDYSAEIPLEKLPEKHPGQWVNYPLGVISEFSKKNIRIGGLDLYYSGNIPAAAGLSSSASVELVTAFAINNLYGCDFGIHDLIHMSIRAEREFVGVQCGIMDQFVVGKGAANAALFLNCATESYEHVPFAPENFRLVIADTKKVRMLSDSKYNERVAECRAGVAAIGKHMPIKSLGELGPEILSHLDRLVHDPVIRKRVRHVVSENHRVLEAVKLLKAGNYEGFGMLMNASHDSLRDDYEVTGYELDAMVSASRRQKGVQGSRMTGAGFGGCTVSLVQKDHVDRFLENVHREYRKYTGLDPEFYLPDIVNGARMI